MQPDAILAHYDIGPVERVTRVRTGLMHGTWSVDTADRRFTLQRLHHMLSTPEIIGDYAAVTGHLAEKGVLAPRLVRTRGGDPVVEDGERWWRLATWVDGEVRQKVKTPIEAEAGARALGRFHRVMADIDHQFGSQHPLHDTAAHLERLRTAVADPANAEPLDAIRPEVDRVLDILPRLVLPTDLPQRVVHGDPKISNVLFEGDRAIGLIDLDTCMRHTVLVDLGDAVRSWCRDGHEDEEQRFHIDRFEAILRGYAAEGPALDVRERALLPGAGPLITLELACRFLWDALTDHYFAWDAERYPSRRAHNTARARGMLFLADDMERQAERMEALVRHHLG